MWTFMTSWSPSQPQESPGLFRLFFPPWHSSILLGSNEDAYQYNSLELLDSESIFDFLLKFLITYLQISIQSRIYTN